MNAALHRRRAFSGKEFALPFAGARRAAKRSGDGTTGYRKWL